MLSPYVAFTENFFLLKFASAFWIILIILSLYHISNKNKKVLWLSVAFPLVWYLGPWLTPVTAVAFFFLWAYYFIKKFENGEKIKHLFYSGLLIGIASAFWDSSLYFGLFFLLSFLFDKKLYNSAIFVVSILAGILPKLIVDYFTFNSPFYGVLKFTGALFSFGFFGGAYGQGYSTLGFINVLDAIIFIPFYFYIFYKKELFLKHKKTIIFLTLSLLFVILFNPQPRPLFIVSPIILLLLGEELAGRRFKIQIILFIILSLLSITPYLIQSTYETNLIRFTLNPSQYSNLKLNSEFSDKIILSDLKQIEKDFSDEIFIVGPDRDHYRKLAHLYWGDKIKEFVSIEDYELFLKQDNTISKFEFRLTPPEKIRREIWLEVGLGKNSKDNTDYNSIKYAISFDEDLGLENFTLKKEYGKLFLFEKS